MGFDVEGSGEVAWPVGEVFGGCCVLGGGEEGSGSKDLKESASEDGWSSSSSFNFSSFERVSPRLGAIFFICRLIFLRPGRVESHETAIHFKKI